jgi:hypothetical protein
LFYRHDTEGRPVPLNTMTSRLTPQFPARPLIETAARLVKTPSRWRWQDWALSNNRENLHRVGGHPCWVQEAEYPRCPDCAQTMSFLLQFDSHLPVSEGEEFLWGSGGIGYAFWCDRCRTSALHWQST